MISKQSEAYKEVQMKVEWKNCIRVGISIFLLYLAITYWGALVNFVGVFFKAAAPLVAGGVIAYLVNILMSFYERHYFPKTKKQFVHKTRRGVCMSLAFLTLLLIICMVIYLVIPELGASIALLINESLPKAIDWVTNSETLSELIPADLLERLATIDWAKALESVVQFLWSGVGSVVGTVASAISSIFSGTLLVFLGIIFAIYLLGGKENLGNQVKRMLKNYLRESWYNKLLHVLTVLNESFHSYVVGQCMEAVILGMLCAIGMLIFRLPYAAMIGTLIGFTALIPVAGAYIGGVVGVILILTVSPVKALIFLIFLVILQQLEGNLIYPRVVGSSIGLPGIWVLAAVTVGGSLMGVVGMLVGVPIAAAIYRLLREDLHRREAAGLVEETLEELEKIPEEKAESTEE